MTPFLVQEWGGDTVQDCEVFNVKTIEQWGICILDYIGQLFTFTFIINTLQRVAEREPLFFASFMPFRGKHFIEQYVPALGSDFT